MKYDVLIHETHYKTISIESESPEKAIEDVKKLALSDLDKWYDSDEIWWFDGGVITVTKSSSTGPPEVLREECIKFYS